MKRILTFMATAILCCSCILDDGHESHHNSQNLRMYSKSMIERHIIQPLGYVDMMLKLDDYLNASEEERLLDKHAFIKLIARSKPRHAPQKFPPLISVATFCFFALSHAK